MPQPIVYVDTSTVRPGCLDSLKAAMSDIAKFVAAHEPQLLSYEVYFSDDGSRMTVMHVNPDESSLELHMKIAGPKFPPVAKYVDLLAIDVYGRPGDALLALLREKAELLGSGTVRVHDRQAGFSRLNG